MPCPVAGLTRCPSGHRITPWCFLHVTFHAGRLTKKKQRQLLHCVASVLIKGKEADAMKVVFGASTPGFLSVCRRDSYCLWSWCQGSCRAEALFTVERPFAWCRPFEPHSRGCVVLLESKGSLFFLFGHCACGVAVWLLRAESWY